MNEKRSDEIWNRAVGDAKSQSIRLDENFWLGQTIEDERTMMPGETIWSGASKTCDCGTEFELEVMRSAAGYYVGTCCHNSQCDRRGAPYTRESEYYRTEEEAQRALDTDTVKWRT